MTAFDIRYDDDGAVRIGWGEPDWLGPIRSHVVDGVIATVEASADRPLVVLRLEATDPMDGVANGAFADPTSYWSFATGERVPDGVPDSAVGFGFQYCEFAMPTITDASLQGWFLFPARPSLVFPMMLIAPDQRTMLIAPLNSFHEQVMAVEGGLRCGWHGDLDVVPAGFTTELAIWGAASPRAALDEWGAELMRRNETDRVIGDDITARPSYWTDNGAAYWYKTEPGYSVADTLVATVDDLRARDVPFSTVQLDSWFYPHQTLRPFNTDEWLVPPSGLMLWEPREDILPDGIDALREALGNPPLTTHCRHVSSASPYLNDYDCWVDGERAHPKTATLYEHWLDDAKGWGVTTFEHDWLIECFLGVRGLREEPGRAKAWQEGIDRAAGERSMTLQWCMPSPADMCQTVSLRNVTTIRTSGDHGYLVSAGYLWAWFLYTNAFASALNLVPYKDCFHTDPDDPGAHAEVEALLSVLSCGPVGIGDPLGRADGAIVRRTCRDDGLLVKPDRPIAAIDRAFQRWATRRNTLMTGTTTSTHATGTWTYVATLNCTDAPAAGRVSLRDIGVTERVAVWNWRNQTIEIMNPDDGWDLELDSLDWDYRVVAPIVNGEAVVGDPTIYATAGAQRFERGDPVDVVVWTESEGLVRRSVTAL